MPKHAVTAAGEAMPAGNILSQLSGKLNAGDVQGALSLLEASAGATATQVPATDDAVLKALKLLEDQIYDIRRAIIVLDEYIDFEFQAGTADLGNSSYPYQLNDQQVDGIRYLKSHVRDLSWDLEKSFNVALEGRILK